ncbi:signal peptidase I [Frondihabitans cladoniiphilus]|uniref:Signal peptidase I n=1 Tax=Frondihabitans cladoniiphilus TaxID=715785 RepID=A0ABP8W7Z1_9MICO
MTDLRSREITTPVVAAPAEPALPSLETRWARAEQRRSRRAARSRRTQTIAIWIGSGLATLLVVAALLFQAHGGRWFIVETPSMGTKAPVGTLVLTQKVDAASLHVGDIITFHPPAEPKETFTHRVVLVRNSVTGPLISTRGDINGAVDPWTLSQEDLVGRAVTVIPRLGWLIRAIPILLVGFTFVMLATRLIRTPSRRVSFRILGFSMLLSITVYVLRPLVGLVVLTATATTKGAAATVVSTGMLPIRVTATNGSTVDLASGQLGVVHVTATPHHVGYHLSSALNLDPWQWVVFFAICAIPMLWTFIVGLPPLRVRDLDDAFEEALAEEHSRERAEKRTARRAGRAAARTDARSAAHGGADA